MADMVSVTKTGMTKHGFASFISEITDMWRTDMFGLVSMLRAKLTAEQYKLLCFRLNSGVPSDKLQFPLPGQRIERGAQYHCDISVLVSTIADLVTIRPDS